MDHVSRKADRLFSLVLQKDTSLVILRIQQSASDLYTTCVMETAVLYFLREDIVYNGTIFGCNPFSRSNVIAVVYAVYIVLAGLYEDWDEL